MVVEGQPLPLPADWKTVKVWPATLMVPLRTLPVFSVTVKLTVPLPVPCELVVSQLTLLTHVQEQFEADDSVNETELADEIKISLVGLSVNTQFELSKLRL